MSEDDVIALWQTMPSFIAKGDVLRFAALIRSAALEEAAGTVEGYRSTWAVGAKEYAAAIRAKKGQA